MTDTPAVTDELVEEVARVLCEAKDINPDCLYQHNFEGDWPEDQRREYIDAFTKKPRTMLFHKAWRHYEKQATDLLPILARQREEGRTEGRNEGIEAAARVAHDHRFEQCGRYTEELCSKIAAAIRALKEPE